MITTKRHISGRERVFATRYTHLTGLNANERIMRLFCKIGLAIALMIELLPNPGWAAARGAVKASAARVDITADALQARVPANGDESSGSSTLCKLSL